MNLTHITPNVMTDQRAKGWPDFHPEDYCHRCGGRNLNWFADSDVWNAVFRKDGYEQSIEHQWQGIICPPCFAELAKAAGIAPIWRLSVWTT